MTCIGKDCQFDSNLTRDHLLQHIRDGIPTRITNDLIHLVPTRADFTDLNMRVAFKRQMDRRSPLLFLPTSIVDKTVWDRGTCKYRIYMFGVLPCGSKTCVILDNAPVYFDVRVPTGTSTGEYDDVLRSRFSDANIRYSYMEDILMLRLHGFQKAKCVWKRIHFTSLNDRKLGIEFLIKESAFRVKAGHEPLETASDDLGGGSYYISKVAREYRFATADWNRLEGYHVVPNETTNCAYTIVIDVKNFRKLRKGPRRAYVSAGTALSKIIDRDPTLVAMWDIETDQTIHTGRPPSPEDTDFTIPMICSSYAHHYSDIPLMSVCCVDKETTPRAGVPLTIVCGTEREVLIAHIRVLGGMAPELLGAFNGGNFDWPLVREKCKRERLLVFMKQTLSSLPITTTGKWADTEENVDKYSFRTEKVKIDAENDHHLECVANFPGMIDTDVMPVFLRLYPRAEVGKAASLNFFLQKNDLESKEDMPIRRMFHIFSRATALREIKKCHCDTATGESTQAECKICCETVKDIDCKRADGNTSILSLDYTDDPHDDLLADDADDAQSSPVHKCCYCGKRPRNHRDMADVAYYCVVDCLRPQQLYVKRTIIPDKRELSTMSYVTLYDSFYRADGMKVCNLIGAYCHKRGVAFSNARVDKPDAAKDHYPGAWVFPPNRGLHSDGFMDVMVDGVLRRIRCRPITGLDFASLYPSLMMAFNFSPDKVVYTLEEAQQLISEGYTLHRIEPFTFERGVKKGLAVNTIHTTSGWTVRHNGVCETDDTRIVEKYVKNIRHTYTRDGVDGSISYPADTGPSADDDALLRQLADEGVAVRRQPVYEGVLGREALPGENMGIFAFIVKKLFDKRVPVKREFVRLAKLKEAMDKKDVRTMDVVVDGKTVTLDYKADVIFNLNKVDSKQKALKVLANTFYGKSGDFRSTIYELLVAAGITCAGQANIKKVAKFVASLGFIAHYGDTDSLYLSCPDHYFAECDAIYADARSRLDEEFKGVACVPEPVDEQEVEYKRRRVEIRIVWWTEQVRISMRVMKELTETVSDFLLADNGTTRLNMAFEEVGFPSDLAGKKKYLMCPHIDDVNFYPQELFVKGIDIIKQGQAGISKMLGEEFMREVLSPENELELIDVAQAKIRKFYSMATDPAMFVQSNRYRPHKKNHAVLAFVERMKETKQRYAADPALAAMYEPPEAGDKFDSVVVKKDLRYTLDGRKVEIKKGDQMEYIHVYKASQSTPNPMEIDMSHYMKGAIIGIFARFIAYHERFQPPAGTYDVLDKDQYAAMDKHCVDAAVKFLTELCDSIAGVDKKAIAQQGRDYRAAYKTASRVVRADAARRYGSAGYILHAIDIFTPNETPSARSTFLINQLRDLAVSMTGVTRVEFDELSCADMGVYKLKRMYMRRTNPNSPPSLMDHRMQIYAARERECTDKLYQVIVPLGQIIAKYEKEFIALIDDMRKVKDVPPSDDELNRMNEFTPGELVTIRATYECLCQLVSVFRARALTLAVYESIILEVARRNNVDITPDINVRAVSRQQAVVATEVTDFDWP